MNLNFLLKNELFCPKMHLSYYKVATVVECFLRRKINILLKTKTLFSNSR